MNDNSTLDSNVLIYAFGKQNDTKKSIAKDIILNCSILSLQAVNETVFVLRKKFNFSFDKIHSVIHFLNKNFTVEKMDIQLSEKAVMIMKKYKYTFWDSMMIAAALQNNCTELYSEDMQNKQVIENRLTIINPFIK